jgi:hypothetical protein
MAMPSNVIVITLALTIGTVGHAQIASSKSIMVNGETRLEVGKAAVTVLTQETPGRKTDISENRNSACTGGRAPCLLTESLKIAVNGKEIYVPYSAFADLGDMAQIKLQHSANRYTLTITGGDAAVAYIAKLVFDSTRVLERVVAPGEDSSQPSERTTYYSPKRFD